MKKNLTLLLLFSSILFVGCNKTDLETIIEPESEIETQSEAETETESEPQTETEAETETELETEPETEPTPIELSAYLEMSAGEMSEIVGNMFFEGDLEEYDEYYSNEEVVIASYPEQEPIGCIQVEDNPLLTLYGVMCGMDYDEAEEHLLNASYTVYSDVTNEDGEVGVRFVNGSATIVLALKDQIIYKYFYSYVDGREFPDLDESTAPANQTKDIKQLLLNHYNSLDYSGTFVIFDDEVTENSSEYNAIIRYQLPQEEADEIIASGGMPSANQLYTDVTVNKNTGTASDGSGSYQLW